MIRDDVTIGDCRLLLGDCRDVEWPEDAAIVSDPPYGMGWDTNSGRFSGGARPAKRRGRRDWSAIAADNRPFDPSPWLAFQRVILWGSNHFACRLPVGTTLVWIKRLDGAFGSFLSDAEVAWMKGGHGVYCRRDMSLNDTTGDRNHPTEKPVSLMSWCIERMGKPPLVADPYMGSGTTAVACVGLGLSFIGAEIDERHFSTACRRIEAAYRQPRLFDEPPPKPVQTSLLEGVA